MRLRIPAKPEYLVLGRLALTDGGDEPIWRLADRLARLIDGDPDRVGLAADWLDVLLRREGR